jgi:hypothetical protein
LIVSYILILWLARLAILLICYYLANFILFYKHQSIAIKDPEIEFWAFSYILWHLSQFKNCQFDCLFP